MANCIDLSSSPVTPVGESITHDNIFATIKELLAASRYAAAYDWFAQHIDYLLNNFTTQELQELLAQAPHDLEQFGPNYLYCRGLVLEQNNQLDLAINYLKDAKKFYLMDGCKSNAIRCALKIARIYHRQENFRLATCYLTEEAKEMIDGDQTIEPGLHATFLLDMAHLATDMGQLSASQEYAEQALQLYAVDGDLHGQFRAQLRIGRNFVQTGKYDEAHRHLQLARQYFHIGKFGAAPEAVLLNAEIHLRWYQWQLDEALHLAKLYLKIADHENLHNARVYARIILGNLYRDKGDFVAARHWYDRTQVIVTENQYLLYQPWLDAQRAWQLTLEERFNAAQRHCHASLQTTDQGQRMSFQVQQAVLHLVNGKAAAALTLLRESLAFYQSSGDPLACCTIQMYLAYAAVRTEKPTELLAYLEETLAWLESRKIDILPHWWNPKIIAEVCAQAVVIDIYPDTIRRIFVNRLGNHAVTPLKKLLRADDLGVRRRAHYLLNMVTGQNITTLAHLPDSPAKTALQELLEQGQLLVDGYPRLEYELMTARQRRHPNPTMIAVYALHILGYKRTAIATRLDCSVENVRNYITAIYQHFALPTAQFASRAARRDQLAQIARGQGFMN